MKSTTVPAVLTSEVTDIRLPRGNIIGRLTDCTRQMDEFPVV